MASKGKDTSRHDKIQEDWNNREYINLVVTSMNKLSNFLNAFDVSCRYRLAVLNQKMETLERKMDFVEGRLELVTGSSAASGAAVPP